MITIEFILLLGFICITHFLDALFTILLVKKTEKYFEHPEEIEVNYHKFFWKKFGLIKGGLIALCISMSAIVIICFALYKWGDIKFLYAIAGMTLTVAYANYMSWSGYEEAREKMKPRCT